MRLTVLGSSASYAGPDNACSGYLVETEHARVLLDCGNGVLSHLGRLIDPLTLDAIVITHGHPDHFADLYAFESLLRYAPQGPAGSLALYAQSGLFEQAAGALCEFGRSQLGQAFRTAPMAAGVPLTVGDIRILPCPVEHSVPTLGLRVSAAGATIAYGSDSSMSNGLIEMLKDVDLALVDATLPDGYVGAAPHLTARQAGEAARSAGARELALVHVWPSNDPVASARDATESFGRPARVANAFDRFTVDGTGVVVDRAL